MQTYLCKWDNNALWALVSPCSRKMITAWVSSMKTPFGSLTVCKCKTPANYSDIIFLKSKIHRECDVCASVKADRLSKVPQYLQSGAIRETHICWTLNLIKIKRRWRRGGWERCGWRWPLQFEVNKPEKTRKPRLPNLPSSFPRGSHLSHSPSSRVPVIPQSSSLSRLACSMTAGRAAFGRCDAPATSKVRSFHVLNNNQSSLHSQVNQNIKNTDSWNEEHGGAVSQCMSAP